MLYREEYGLHAGPVGLGTFAFSGQLSAVSPERAAEVLDAYVDAGGRYVETAPSYARPSVDLGRLLKRYPRDALVLATKCVVGQSGERSGRLRVQAQLQAEARRLGVDHIDLVQVRMLEGGEDLAGALAALDELRGVGRVRWIGLSRVASPAVIAAAAGAIRLDLLQNRMSLVRRGEFSAELIEYCRHQGIAMNPCQVLERGQLCDTTVEPDQRGVRDIRRTKAEYNDLRHAAIRHWVMSRLAPLARECGISCAQLSLGWTLAQPSVALAVVGATTADQIRHAMTAPHGLPADVVARIEREVRLLDTELSGRKRECADDGDA